MNTPLGAYAPAVETAQGEKTSTGGWPTGVLELQGGPSAEATPVAPESLASDPFAAFAVQSAPPSERTPPGYELAGRDPGALGGLPVTDLSDLERTGAAPVPAPPGGPSDFPAAGDLSLEERTPPASSLREAQARWGDPEATSAVAIGPDGFQEVDLSASSTPPDPAFDAFGPEPTPVPPLPRGAEPAAAPSSASPPAGAPAPEVAAVPAAAAAAGVAATLPPATPDPTGRAPEAAPARYRAFAMNVLSLAALLVVTASMLAWWGGEGVTGLFRGAGGTAGRVEVANVASGVYGVEGAVPVVFVRGVVRAPREAVQGPVLVRVELLRRGAPVASTTAAAGAVPGPEELAGLTSAADADRLRGELARRAAPRIEAGAEVPFLAFVPQPPGDPGSLSFRVAPVAPAGR